ncbi:MAG: hypothetical protein GW886_05120 [Rhodobacterales bacterium]|nr:hypothetical protein [Rhodobacterales bacterium]NCT12429.1 hypothetical protein [Rhodobacterales bacterium]
MIAAAPAMANLFLSVAALTGLAVLHGVVAGRGRFDPLNRRFLIGLRVTMLLFAGRALVGLTGVEAFRNLVLFAAALVPIAVLILTEGLLRRHAPPWIKAGIGVGTLVFALAALVPASLADPLRLYALLAFQIGGLMAAGLLVVTRDKASLSAQENRAVERLGLSLILLIPLAAADFLTSDIGLPVQVSALAVLFLCWLALSLGRDEARHRGALASFVAVVLAGGLVAAALAFIVPLDMDGTIITAALILAAMLVAVILNDARALRGEEQTLSLLHLLADGRDDLPGFLRGLQGQPLVEGAVLVGADDLADLDTAVLDALFDARPVLRRTDAGRASGDESDHIAHLFDRFAATHVIRASRAPLTLLALSMPAIAASPRAELELRAVQHMASLLSERRG